MELEDKGNDTDAKAPVVEPKGETINLRVASQDGNEVFFRIRTNTPLSKMIDAYCDRQSIPRSAVRFMFDGERINETETPASLDMEENDVIDAMLQQLWLPNANIPDAWDNLHVPRVRHFIGDDKNTRTALFAFTLNLDDVDTFYRTPSTLVMHRTNLDTKQTHMQRVCEFSKPRPAYCDHELLRQSRVGKRTIDRLREGSLIYYAIEVPIPPPSAAVNEEWRLGIQLKTKRWLVESDVVWVCWRFKAHFRV